MQTIMDHSLMCIVRISCPMPVFPSPVHWSASAVGAWSCTLLRIPVVNVQTAIKMESQRVEKNELRNSLIFLCGRRLSSDAETAALRLPALYNVQPLSNSSKWVSPHIASTKQRGPDSFVSVFLKL